MCCGFLLTEVLFLVLYVLTAPSLTASSGPHLLLHLYLIYTGYSFLGAALSSFSPFLREVIQVCVCGVVLVCYPLTLVPAPILDALATILLIISPLLSLVEGYAIYQLTTKMSRSLTDNIEDNELLKKISIIFISMFSIIISLYLNVVYLDLHPSTKVLILASAALLIIVNIAKEEGIISDACVLVLVSYLIITFTSSPTSGTKPPPFSTLSQAQTMLGAIVRIPQIISYSVSSVLPYARQLLAPVPLGMLAVRAICVALYSDKLLDQESWFRGLGKFLVVTLYTSYVLGATQTTAPWLGVVTVACRGAEVTLMIGAYLVYLFGYNELLDESF